MSTATLTGRAPATQARSLTERLKEDPGYQAFLLLRIGFAVAPILFGLDKFFDVMVDWQIYLASPINDLIPGARRMPCTRSASSRSPRASRWR